MRAPLAGISAVQALVERGGRLAIGGMIGAEAVGLHRVACNAGIGLASMVGHANSLELSRISAAPPSRAPGSDRRCAPCRSASCRRGRCRKRWRPIMCRRTPARAGAGAADIAAIRGQMPFPDRVSAGGAQAPRAESRRGLAFAPPAPR
ncbi:hypothetical protein LNKW23_23100 [Paralimibaculum aggregatum]|uniref:Alcohol dehydrogenase-like C-terminal domain-containing protein n=1 Tax=Paralimibaculum aggregatum TaxID=3036245 RepID=A0ABQ6LJD9_9RHOB|nr:hypothetical protein [Limibaculum sp. NKW23]GMG83097.1 hypothetical protein LNKW23_23100 [Limibaculum sp. NKW23]